MKKLVALGIFIFSLTFILPSAPARQVEILVVAGHVQQDEQGECPQPGSVYFSSGPVLLGTEEFRENLDTARTIALARSDCNAHIQIDPMGDREKFVR